MRIFKLTFAVLALMSVFTACTKDELPTQQEVAGVSGAKLLGTNLSAEFAFGAQTKVDAYGNWTIGDKLGLAWVNDQNALSANYLFQLGEDSLFATYGNVYEGTHFAYYPYAYMPAPGVKKVVINPKQTETIGKDIFTTRLHLSTKQGLTAAHNLDGDKLVNGNFTLRRAVKALKVTLDISDSIKTSAALKDLKIKKVTLTAEGKDIFAGGEVTLNPNSLATPVYVDEEGDVVASTNCTVAGHNHTPAAPAAVYPAGSTYSESETAKAFYSNLMSVFGTPTYTEALATEVDNANIKLSDDQNIRFYTLPKAGVDTTGLPAVLKLRVDVQNGYFEVDYKVKSASYTPTADEVANTNALKELAYLFYDDAQASKDGYLAAFSPEQEAGLGKALTFTLTPKMFHQSFDNIASEADWNAAVAMVDALGIKNPTFTIVQGATPWKFVDADKDSILVNLPTSNTILTVDGGTMYFNKEDATAPITSNKFVVNTNIVVEKNLKVAGALKVGTGKTITNNAVISAGAAADIDNLVNTGKRVIADFGAKVKVTENDTKGTVAYVVKSIAQNDYANVRTMLTHGSIKVNTLVIDGVAFDLNAKCIATSGNSYVDGSTEYLSTNDVLKYVTFELVNGGSLTANNTDLDADDRKYQVAEVISVSGTNTITDIHIADSLIVKAGALTAVNTKLAAEDAVGVVIAGDATLNLNPTPATRAANSTNSVAYVEDLMVNGTLNVNINGLTAKRVIVAASGDLNVTGYNYFVWSEKGELKGTTSGTISRGAQNYDELEGLIKLAQEGETIYLASDVNATKKFTIEANKNITLNLNGKTLTTSVTFDETDDIVVKGTLSVKNGKVSTANTAFVADGGHLTLTDCEVTASSDCGWALAQAINKGTLNISGGSYKGKQSSGYDLYVIGVQGGSSATINTTVSGGNGGITVIGASTANITGGSYTGVKACGLYVAGGSTVTYSSNCTFKGVEGNVVVGGGDYGKGTVNGKTYDVYTKVM